MIIATGSDDSAVEMELFAAGDDDYVVKPIDPPRFVLRVQAVLRRRGGVGPPSCSSQAAPPEAAGEAKPCWR